jgi:hypothetical protein
MSRSPANGSLVPTDRLRPRRISAFACLLAGAAQALASCGPSAPEPNHPSSAPAQPTADAGAPAAAIANVPYSLSLEAFSVEGFPGLHSMVHADLDGKLVLLAGRKNGMHGFPPRRSAQLIAAFPVTQANDTVYVLDLAARKLLGSASVAALPAAVANQLRATNCQYFTREGQLYVVGGYGASADGKSMLTYPQVLAIDLKALVDSVVAGRALDASFAKSSIHIGQHPALAVSGGGMRPLGSNVLLAFGHQYDGLYTTDSSLAQQTYSDSVRAFRFALSKRPGSAGLPSVEVDYRGKYPDPPATGAQPSPDGPYHRRDFTFLPALGPDGGALLATYGGVFKGGRMEGYLTPIYIAAKDDSKLGFAVTEDTTAQQWLSQYDTAAVPLYSARARAMYVTFLGGISQYYWDPQAQALKHDSADFTQDPPVDGLPFINSISTLRVGGASSGQFLHVAEQFPPSGSEPRCGTQTAGYLGADGAFVPEPSAPSKDGVIQLDAIRSRQTLGYVIGGIASTAPYPGSATCASNLLYAVTASPDTATDAVELVAPVVSP